MIKLLFLVPHLENKGPMSQLLALVNNLNFRRYKVSIICLFDERSNSLINEFSRDGIEIIKLCKRRWDLIGLRRAIKKNIDKLSPDIIHSTSAITDCIISTMRIKTPLVITLHNYMYDDLIVQYGKIIGGLMCCFEKKAIYIARVPVACSKSLEEKYKQIINRKIVCVQNGIDVDKWKESFANKNELRQKYRVDQDGYIFISTGLMLERKDPLTIIKAFKRISDKNAKLIMLGDGELLEKCKNEALGDERIRFTGRVDNVKDYLYLSDTLVSASFSEGLPYAILEASCTGIRMILSDIPQHHEAVCDNSNVSFFKTGDYKTLSELMGQNMTLTSRIKYDVDCFSARTMSNKYQKIYEKIVGGQ